MKQVLDWSGGNLDDLVALLSAPSWSARIEVLPSGGGNPVGEVHVIAGGVSDAIFEGKSTHESLDKLRAVKGTRFRVEPRLPNPANGDLTVPGPDQGKLEERPLATLMRYCEEFVLTASIEVWRASENAKVDYRRGEIVGVTVGGIDAPERLAEVMKWASGSYRVIVPRLTLPETAPKAAAPAAIVAPRSTGAPSKTIFGMPALDPAAISAAAEKARQTKTGGHAVLAPAASPSPPGMAPAPPPAVPRPTPLRPTAAPVAVTATTAPPNSAPAAVSPGAPASAQPQAVAARAAANRTIFGVAPAPAPTTPAPTTPVPAATARQGTPAATVAAPVAPAQTARPSAVNIPVVADKAPDAPAKSAEKALEKATEKPAGKQSRSPAPAADDATLPTKAPKPARGTPVWIYAVVGLVFGGVLLGIYRVVTMLGH